MARHVGSAEGASLAASLAALGAGRFVAAAAKARRALDAAPDCGLAWRLIGMSLEGQGDRAGALDAYERAVRLAPGSPDLLVDLGRMATALGLDAVATELLTRARRLDPVSIPIAVQLAQALRAQHAYAAATALLDEALAAAGEDASLWNAVGEVRLQQGELAGALEALDRALALEPHTVEALYNRACVRSDLGDFGGALGDGEAALRHADPDRKPAIRFVQALAHLCRGELAAGWDGYEARLHPYFARSATFRVPGRRWAPADRLEGRRLLVVGEQGLGDELMFSGLVPEAIDAVGPRGVLTLAVQPRLAALMRRSFPAAAIVTHKTTAAADGRAERSVPAAPPHDLWTPIGSLTRRFRTELADFDRPAGYLKPDPGSVAAWRGALDALDDRLKVGVSWKSMKTYGERLKGFAPFAAWEGVLRTPGVRFVNLQYGDCAAELEQARRLGADIWSAPGLDLDNDLDEAAALSAALDLVIGFPNASTNLAAACGAPAFIVFPPAAWPCLGSGRQPWFPQARLFTARGVGEWDGVMAEVALALADLASSRTAEG